MITSRMIALVYGNGALLIDLGPLSLPEIILIIGGQDAKEIWLILFSNLYR